MPIAAGELTLFPEGFWDTSLPPQERGEAKLIQRTKSGDVRAFNELIRAYQTRAFRLAYRLLGDTEMAADATQEAFISAYRHMSAVRGSSLSAWLMRVVTNACYDQLRDKRKQRSYSFEALTGDTARSPAWVPRSGSGSPEELAERRELNERIQRALAGLPFEQRVMVLLADIEEYSYEQISEITQVNVGTVKSRLARGRATLRDLLLADQSFLPRTYRPRSTRAESRIES